MRVLMVSPYLLWPLHGGGVIRMHAIARELARRGHRIVLLAGADPIAPTPGPVLDGVCEEVVSYQLPRRGLLTTPLGSLASRWPYPTQRFVSRSLRVQLLQLLSTRRFDVLWINFAMLAQVLVGLDMGGIPVVLDEHESEELVWRGFLKQGSPAQQAFALVNLAKVLRLRERLWTRLNAVFCVSDQETQALRARAPRGLSVSTVPNGVEVESHRPVPWRHKQGHILLMCGNMSVRRNVQAARWCAQRILPAVRSAVPDAELWLVGSNPAPTLRRLERLPGVRVSGTVDDVRPYYGLAKVAMAPYRFGAGTRLKILEAMANGVPIVSTRMGCVGIEVDDGRHVLIADDAARFSARVIGLLRNPEQAEALAAASLARVKDRYDWKGIVSSVEEHLLGLIGYPQGRLAASTSDSTEASLASTGRGAC